MHPVIPKRDLKYFYIKKQVCCDKTAKDLNNETLIRQYTTPKTEQGMRNKIFNKKILGDLLFFN